MYSAITENSGLVAYRQNNDKRANRVQPRPAVGKPIIIPCTGSGASRLCYCPASYIFLVPPHIFCSFDYPNDGVNQEFPGQHPHKAVL